MYKKEKFEEKNYSMGVRNTTGSVMILWTQVVASVVDGENSEHLFDARERSR